VIRKNNKITAISPEYFGSKATQRSVSSSEAVRYRQMTWNHKIFWCSWLLKCWKAF